MRYCGCYSVKGVLSAYALGDGREPRMYLPPFKRQLDLATPSTLVKILEDHRLHASVHHAGQLSPANKIALLKNELKKGNPVILLISNSYDHEGNYRQFIGKIVGHWISMWGFDDTKKVFFVYDSFRERNSFDKVPIGNVQKPYDVLLRDWKGPFFLLSRYVYITVA